MVYWIVRQLRFTHRFYADTLYASAPILRALSLSLSFSNFFSLRKQISSNDLKSRRKFSNVKMLVNIPYNRIRNEETSPIEKFDSPDDGSRRNLWWNFEEREKKFDGLDSGCYYYLPSLSDRIIGHRR